MNVEYKYRKHMRYVEYFMSILFLLVIVTGWSLVFILSKGLTSELKVEFYTAAIVCTILFSINILTSFFSIIKLKRGHIRLSDDKVIYSSSCRREVTVSVVDIVKIEFKYVSFIWGCMAIKTADKTKIVKVSADIKGIDMFLENFKEILMRNNMESCYAMDNYKRFQRFVNFEEESWSRLYKQSAKLMIILLISMLLGISGSYIFHSGLKKLAVMITLSIFGTAATYAGSEFSAWRNFCKRSGAGEVANEKYAKNALKISTAVYFMLYMIILIACLR